MNNHFDNCGTLSITVRNRVVTLALLFFTGACGSTGFHSVTPQTVAVGDSRGNSIYQLAAPTSENFLDAERQLRGNVEADTGNVDAHLRLAVLYRQMEKFDQAERAINTAMQLSNHALNVQNERAILQRAQGQFEQAKNTYAAILQVDPNYANAHFNLGILYDLYLHEPEQAHAHYEAYLKTAPKADVRVEKWLVDLQRRFGLDANTSMVQVSE